MSPDERWSSTWQTLGLQPPDESFSKLLNSYAEPHRAYHTLTHICACLARFDTVRELAGHPGEVELAIWFHDAVYDPKRSDNEEQSACWAHRTLIEAGATPAVAQRVYELILATKHAAEPVGLDAALLVDIDLSILGAAPERFDDYERQVRQEYAWVPEVVFRRTRAGILRGFLARERIYHTQPFVERFEAPARANLQRSLDKLSA